MNKTLPLVSVVIPVYNNANYIKACIDSAINQTYKNIEIIIVNDGSEDDTLFIIEQCMRVDSRIICINQSNKGTNLARKAGLDMAKGKYVQYLDGDDTLFPDAIACLVKMAEETSADIVSAPFVFCYADGSKQCSPILQMNQLSGIEYFRKIFDWEGATWNMWGNFQKRSLVYQYDIDIIQDIPYSQDATWMIQLFFQNIKIAVIKTPIVNYNYNTQSVTHSKTAASKRYSGARTLYFWFEQFLKNRKLEHDFKKELAIMQLNMTMICIHALHHENIREDMKNLINNLNVYPDLIRGLSRFDKLFIEVFKLSSSFGYFFVLVYKIKRYIIR